MSDLPPASEATPAPVSPLIAGPLGRCPRCGKGTIFSGFLSLADRCEACGLDLRFADPGDGPSFFASFIGGFLVLLAGVTAQIAYDATWWVYAIILIVGTAATIGLIRPLKGLLVALQYSNKAEQGRLEP